MKYVVTGATGRLGNLIAENLLRHLDASEVGISVREPAKAKSLADRGVRVREGDFSSPAKLVQAFEGADSVIVISPPVLGEAGATLTRNAIDAAKTARVRRVLYTSHMAASEHSLFPPMLNHAAAERALAESGLETLALRNGFYADAALRNLESALKSGEIAVPADGPMSWTTHEDLAEYAALELINGSQRGFTSPLTAGEAFDFAQMAAVIAELTGKPVRRTQISDEDFVEKMRAMKMPPERIDIGLGMFKASRVGEFSRIDGELKSKIRREPQTLRDAIKMRLNLN